MLVRGGMKHVCIHHHCVVILHQGFVFLDKFESNEHMARKRCNHSPAVDVHSRVLLLPTIVCSSNDSVQGSKALDLHCRSMKVCKRTCKGACSSMPPWRRCTALVQIVAIDRGPRSIDHGLVCMNVSTSCFCCTRNIYGSWHCCPDIGCFAVCCGSGGGSTRNTTFYAVCAA